MTTKAANTVVQELHQLLETQTIKKEKLLEFNYLLCPNLHLWLYQRVLHNHEMIVLIVLKQYFL